MGAKGEEQVTTKLPKGFEIVPDERLPSGPPAAAPEIPDGTEIGTSATGKKILRRNIGEDQYVDVVVNDDGSESAYSEIVGDLDAGDDEEPEAMLPDDPGLPEGFEVTEEVVDVPAEDVPEERQAPRVGTMGAVGSGFKSGVTFGFDDELQAATGTLGNMIGTMVGANESTASAREIFQQMLKERRDVKDAAFDQHPIAYGAGALPGMVLTAPAVGGRVAQGGSAIRNTLNLAGAGARGGAVSGAGNNEGDLGDLVGNTAEGAAWGGVAAPLAQPVVNMLGAGAGAIRNALRPRTAAADSGLDVLSRQTDLDPAAMRAAADEMQAAGVDPRLVDVVDESGRAVIRSAGSRMTPARQELTEHANTVYTNAQGRIANQARRISDRPGTARGALRQIEEEQAAMGPRFDAVRDEPVTLTPELIQAFTTAEGRSVLRTIGRYMGPAERQQLDDFIASVGRANRDPDEAIRRQFPGDWDALPDQVKASIRAQMGVQEEPVAPLTVDIADKFARVITKRAQDNPALMRVARQYAETVRGAARQQHPAYDEALEQFAARGRVGDAAGGTGRYEDTNFLLTPQDEFAANIAPANREAAALLDDAGNPTLSEADAIAMRARDAVVDAATSGRGARATATARQLSEGDAQRARNAALLGPEEAARLEAGMAAEARRVDNTRFIDPRTGSQTQSRAQDAGEAGMDIAANIASGGKWAAVRAATQFIRMAGVRGVDVERLVRDSIDPARTRAAIDFLEQRGMERERARSLMRSISSTLGGRLGGAQSYDKPDQPRSGRSITNNSRRLNQGAE